MWEEVSNLTKCSVFTQSETLFVDGEKLKNHQIRD